jgi:3-deoxy-7-phosphoheptulonate synthase / chorismate mutase
MSPQRPVDPEIRRLRERIDRVNREILKLVQERGALLVDMAALKDSLKLDSYDPRREAEMMRELTGGGEGPFSREELATIFRALFAASLELERRSRASAAAADESSAAHPVPHIKAVGT